MAVASEELPEELVLNIFSRLPVKSLIRFSTVSKRMHSIIFNDPKFAQLQFRAAPRQISRRLLVSTDVELLQLDDDTPSFGDPSSVRKPTLPFQLQQLGDYVTLLGSCNGLVFLTLNTYPQFGSSPIFFERSFYIWNPSLGYFKKLPDLSFSSWHDFKYYGVGYVCSIDDYRVLVGYYANSMYNFKMFSLRTHIWETIDCSPAGVVLSSGEGTLFNDALHGINLKDKHELVCFDLAVKQFRRMRLPSFDNDEQHFSKLAVYGGCLSVVRYRSDSIYMWVMREYEVSDSWTMLFSLKLSDLPKNMKLWLVMEGSTVVVSWPDKGCELIMIDHKDGQRLGQYMLQGFKYMIVYEESLLWISDYASVEKTEQVQELESHQKGFTKLK